MYEIYLNEFTWFGHSVCKGLKIIPLNYIKVLNAYIERNTLQLEDKWGIGNQCDTKALPNWAKPTFHHTGMELRKGWCPKYAKVLSQIHSGIVSKIQHLTALFLQHQLITLKLGGPYSNSIIHKVSSQLLSLKTQL